MTSDKRHKARIRARMARTGERYTTARRHLLGATATAPDHRDLGYRLRGGQHPDTAGLAAILAHHGVALPDGGELSEELLFGIAGGLGAGYILWEFTAHDARTLVLGFSNQWQYQARGLRTTLERLRIPADEHATSGTAGAARRLDAQLDSGQPALIWPDRQLLGHWYLPAHLEGHGGDPVVVYGRTGDRVHIDDRTLAPLTVAAADLHRARARVDSYRNLLIAPHPAPGPVDGAVLRDAVTAGIGQCVAQLTSSSASFSLPAWRKWGRLMTSARNDKGWPRVFADGRGLVGALLSVWEGASQSGMTGGHLRDLYARFLDEAAGLTGVDLAPVSARLRQAGALWERLGDEAVTTDDPGFARLRELTATVRYAIAADGDAGRDEAAAAAGELWQLRAAADADCPIAPADRETVFARMSQTLAEIHEVETTAITDLSHAAATMR